MRRNPKVTLDNLKCVKGVLITPFILSTDNYGNIDVQKETFYKSGDVYYFQLDCTVWPYRIVKAIRERL